jgi:hypothetical protein
MPHAPACLSASALAPGKHSTSTDTSARVSGQPACAGGAFSHGLAVGRAQTAATRSLRRAAQLVRAAFEQHGPKPECAAWFPSRNGKCAAIEERQTSPLPLELPAAAQRPRRPVSRLRLGNDRIQGVGIAGRANREGLIAGQNRKELISNVSFRSAPKAISSSEPTVTQKKTYLSIQTSSIRQLLKMLLTISVSPLTCGRRQVPPG